MRRNVSLSTTYDQYTDTYYGEYENYHQIHIFSAPEIISTYFDPEFVQIEQVRTVAQNALIDIRRKSDRRDKITLFEKEGVFLIAEHPQLIEPLEMLIFNSEIGKYEWDEDQCDLFELIGDTPADLFVRNAIVTVGAERLFPVLEPFAMKLAQNQDRLRDQYIEWRENNKTNPLLKIEVYRIEKNYVPVLIQEIPCNCYASGYCLPEHKFLMKTDERTTSLLREIATGKVIDGSLEEAIESAKYQKWSRKHPAIMDPADLMRMELDDDDPDFLSWDDYVANDNESEEGDDEYSPGRY